MLNLSDPVRRTIGEVGIDRILTVHCGSTDLPEIPLRKLEPIDETDREHAERMLSAHETLCQVEPKNLEQFDAFIRMLRAELGQDQGRRNG